MPLSYINQVHFDAAMNESDRLGHEAFRNAQTLDNKYQQGRKFRITEVKMLYPGRSNWYEARPLLHRASVLANPNLPHIDFSKNSAIKMLNKGAHNFLLTRGFYI